MPLTTQQIAELVGGTLDGPGGVSIVSMERIDAAGGDQLTFITDERYAARWQGSGAGAAIIHKSLQLSASHGQALIRVENVDVAVARVLEALAPEPLLPAPGVHASAVVEKGAVLGAGVRIGAHGYVGLGARLGDGVVLHPGACVHGESVIGAGTVLWSGAVVRERCVVGARCILHPNATIGADGFGFRPAPDGRSLLKVPQIGNVVIGDGVEIGANTCVDRAKFGSTTIGDGCKIDNLCQIAHNCRVGRCVILAGGCMIGGSVEIGDGAQLGGGVSVRDHMKIGAGAKLMACSAVMNDVTAGETWAGYPAKEAKITLREHASLRHLPDMVRGFKKGKG